MLIPKSNCLFVPAEHLLVAHDAHSAPREKPTADGLRYVGLKVPCRTAEHGWCGFLQVEELTNTS